MQRLIAILEILLATSVGLLFMALAFAKDLYGGRLVTMLVVAAALTTLLLMIVFSFSGDDIRPSKKERKNARKPKALLVSDKPLSTGNGLIFLGATFGVLGLFYLLSGGAFCGPRPRGFCSVLEAVATPIGFDDLDTGVAVILLLAGVFVCAGGFWMNRSLVQQSPQARR